MELRTDLPEALLRNALSLAAQGWAVFPLRPDDKRPAFPNHSAAGCTGRDPRCRSAGGHVGWEARATTDPDRIRRAWSMAPFNIGIACGPSGLVVVDLDTPKPGQIPPDSDPPLTCGADTFGWLEAAHTDTGSAMDTFTVRTGRGGWHLYYRHPEDGPVLRNTAGSLGWLIDTRAHGGYVVAPGSVVAGRLYAVTRDIDPTALPVWLASKLAPAPTPPREPVVVSLGDGRRTAFLDRAVTASLTAIDGAKANGRLNATLYGAAASLGELVAGGALDPQETETLLVRAAVDAGHPESGARRTIRSGFRRGATRPRTVAA